MCDTVSVVNVKRNYSIMINLISQVHNNHIQQDFYQIQDDNKVIVSDTINESQALETAKKLFVLSQTKDLDPKKKRIVTSCTFDYLRWIEKKKLITKDVKDTFDAMYAHALLNLFIEDPEPYQIESMVKQIEQNTPWYQFIIANHIHYSTHSQQVSFNKDVIDKVCIQGQWVNFSSLEMKKTKEGYGFYADNRMLFQTDQNFKLKGYSYLGHEGIVQGTAKDIDGLNAFFKRPASGKYWLSVYVNSKHPGQVQFGQSHSYLGLEDAEGNLNYVGQYGLTDNFAYADYISPFGKKKMGIEIPDRYSGLPLARYDIKETRIEITEEEYKKLTESIKRDKENSVEGDLIQGNCSEYVAKKLKMIGIKAKTTLTFQDFLLRMAIQVFPKKLQNRVIQYTQSLSDTVKKVAHFNPFLYPVVIVCTAIVSLLSWGSVKKFSVIDAIFRPWRVKVSHPIALGDWIEEFNQHQHKYSILSTRAQSDSKIGRLVSSIHENLGYRKDEQKRFFTERKAHVTQHHEPSFLVLVIKTIFNAIVFHIKNWFSDGERIDRNTTLLYLHSLHSQKFISPYQFKDLSDAVDNPKEFARRMEELLTSMMDQKLIDRRSYIHLKEKLRTDSRDSVLQYIVGVSLLNSINSSQHYDTIKELITPKVQMQITHYLKNYEKNYSFSPKAVGLIQKFVQSVHCYEWAQKIEDVSAREEICKALKLQDEEYFSRSIRYYLSNKKSAEGISSIEESIIEDMIQSLKTPQRGSPFTAFSHNLQTQSSLMHAHQLIINLKNQLHSSMDRISEEDINDLRTLHQNMGVYLEANVSYTGSAMFASSILGKMRRDWEEIDAILSRRIVPKGNENDVWPDLGFREITETKNLDLDINKETENPLKGKKVFFGFCSWGGGHKSVTQALAKAFGQETRFVACDVPDEILIQKDPLFNALGPGNSITTLYNTCLSNNYWSLLDFMKDLGQGTTPENERQIQKNLIKQKLIQEQPDVVVATYEKHSDLMLEAAKELGIPFVQVYTDMISEIADHVKEAFNDGGDYPHKRILSPYPIPEMQKCYEDAGIDPKEACYMGYPVRQEFMTAFDKNELREKYNVKKGQKVVLCMSGAAGVETPWPEMIAQAQRGELSNIKLIVVCGRNKDFYQKLSQLKAKDPTIDIEARGFTQAQEMAEISALADLTITKPGGATLAENILMKNYLLLDTRFSKSLPWELEAAQALEKKGLATSIGSRKSFIQALKEGLGKEVPEVSSFHQFDGRVNETFVENLSELIHTAEKSHEAMNQRHSSYNLGSLYPMMDMRGISRENFEKNLSQLIHLNDRMNPGNVVESLKSALWEAMDKGKFIGFNHGTASFTVINTINLDHLEYALDVAIRCITNKNDLIGLEDLERISKLIHKAKHSKLSDITPLFKRLQKLDFVIASKKLKKVNVQNMTIEQLEPYFYTKEAFKVLKGLADLQTSRSRRNLKKYGDERVFDEKELLQAFIHNPEELEFLKMMHLHRKISAFDHKIKVGKFYHINILVDGEFVPICRIMDQFRFINDKIICIANEQEYDYTYNLGLTSIKEGQHPVHWQEDIPVFKVKDRQTKDYRIEIMTVTENENHSWIRLKDPMGNVYSVGAFWDPDYQLAPIQRLNTMPGYIRGGGDLQEFLGQEKHWKRTKIILNSKEFRSLKNYIIKSKRQGMRYNLVNSNCTSFVARVLQKLGVKYNISDSPVVAMLMPKPIRRYLMINPELRNVVETLTYPVRLIQNIGMSLLGMFKEKDVEHIIQEAGFSKPYDIFTWENGVVDTPSQMKILQELLEEEYSKEGKIDFRQFASTSKSNAVFESQVGRVCGM